MRQNTSLDHMLETSSARQSGRAFPWPWVLGGGAVLVGVGAGLALALRRPRIPGAFPLPALTPAATEPPGPGLSGSAATVSARLQPLRDFPVPQPEPMQIASLTPFRPILGESERTPSELVLTATVHTAVDADVEVKLDLLVPPGVRIAERLERSRVSLRNKYQSEVGRWLLVGTPPLRGTVQLRMQARTADETFDLLATQRLDWSQQLGPVELTRDP